MADVVVASPALDVAAADDNVGEITRSGEGLGAGSVSSCNFGFPIGGKERIFEEDGRRVSIEDSGGSVLGVCVVVMKAELGVRAHLRVHIQVSECIESKLLGGPA